MSRGVSTSLIHAPRGVSDPNWTLLPIGILTGNMAIWTCDRLSLGFNFSTRLQVSTLLKLNWVGERGCEKCEDSYCVELHF